MTTPTLRKTPDSASTHRSRPSDALTAIDERIVDLLSARVELVLGSELDGRNRESPPNEHAVRELLRVVETLTRREVARRRAAMRLFQGH